ncbi:MAG: hypothetical protein CMM58_07450 [Rhodospirillaceae bacterium]|nr:hypothetical protein [Rhodospirillaceae bacterium]|tara:strand:+ start:538 stop:1377 length:840 start_codon:yes stop_codon:yes gene_type:complete
MAKTPLWSAVLDHLCLETSEMEIMRKFYCKALGLQEKEVGNNQWLLEGPGRRLILSEGTSKYLSYSSFRVEDDVRLLELKKYILDRGAILVENPSPLFQQGAFTVVDPDGNKICFGVGTEPTDGLQGLDGRLQHVVVASSDIKGMMEYYQQVLGFLPSDIVSAQDGRVTAAFYRSDPEHHSFATFAADTKGFDHCAFETPSWNHIRDWADHLAALDIPIWWGPGRHGAGNNLFFMVLDPDGNKIELSAELELMDSDHPLRYWPHDRRTLNLWGNAWMRS